VLDNDVPHEADCLGTVQVISQLPFPEGGRQAEVDHRDEAPCQPSEVLVVVGGDIEHLAQALGEANAVGSWPRRVPEVAPEMDDQRQVELRFGTPVRLAPRQRDPRGPVGTSFQERHRLGAPAGQASRQALHQCAQVGTDADRDWFLAEVDLEPRYETAELVEPGYRPSTSQSAVGKISGSGSMRTVVPDREAAPQRTRLVMAVPREKDC